MKISQILGFLLHLCICFTSISGLNLLDDKEELMKNSPIENVVNIPELLQNNIISAVVRDQCNKGADEVLNGLNSALKDVTVFLPDSDKKIGQAPYGGICKLIGGYIKDIVTTRTADVEINIKNMTAALNIPLGVKIGEAGVDNYFCDVLSLYRKGNVKVGIPVISVCLKLTLTCLPICTCKLDELKVVELKDFKVDINESGKSLSIFNGVLLPWISTNFKTQCEEMINRIMYEVVNQVIPNVNILKNIPLI